MVARYVPRLVPRVCVLLALYLTARQHVCYPLLCLERTSSCLPCLANLMPCLAYLPLSPYTLPAVCTLAFSPRRLEPLYTLYLHYRLIWLRWLGCGLVGRSFNTFPFSPAYLPPDVRLLTLGLQQRAALTLYTAPSLPQRLAFMLVYLRFIPWCRLNVGGSLVRWTALADGQPSPCPSSNPSSPLIFSLCLGARTGFCACPALPCMILALPHYL